jgi:hypothetical protein
MILRPYTPVLGTCMQQGGEKDLNCDAIAAQANKQTCEKIRAQKGGKMCYYSVVLL